MQDLIIYQHIYKNGGSSIREGYMHCKKHKRLVDNGARIFMLDDNDNKIPFDMKCLLSEDKPVFFTGSVNAYKVRDILDTTRRNPHYVITFREPVNRLMSAYNYYNFYLKDVCKIDHIMDFEVWFMNKRKLKPVAWDFQYIDLITKKFPVLEKSEWYKLLQDNYDSIDHASYVDMALEQLDYWKPTVIKLEQNHIRQMRELLNEYHPGEFEFEERMRFYNSAKDFKIDYILTFDQLSSNIQSQVLEELADETRFYELCLA